MAPGHTAQLSSALQVIGTLEEVHMPQNGINHPGVTALAQAFAINPLLRVINLNDNTFTEKGAVAMAEVRVCPRGSAPTFPPLHLEYLVAPLICTEQSSVSHSPCCWVTSVSSVAGAGQVAKEEAAVALFSHWCIQCLLIKPFVYAQFVPGGG